jgi:biotin synthase-like enzyme
VVILIIMSLTKLREKANKIYLSHFGPCTNFERAVFFSWYCAIRDCKYCYMSTQPSDKQPYEARRRIESVLAEVYLLDKLGWDFGQLSGGHKAFETRELEYLLKHIYKIHKQGIWLNAGPLAESQIVSFKPYIKGIVGALETIEPTLHNHICPSKPITEIQRTLKLALKHRLATSITIILGLGEKKKDYNLLKQFITKYKISVIHYYALNPQKGTAFEHKKSPSEDYQGWWISKTRIDFPNIHIQCGIWADKVNQVAYLLESGANTVSKFPALKLFGKKEAVELEKQFLKANRKPLGTLTRLPEMDPVMDLSKLDVAETLKPRVIEKINLYLKKMKKSASYR